MQQLHTCVCVVRQPWWRSTPSTVLLHARGTVCMHTHTVTHSSGTRKQDTQGQHGGMPPPPLQHTTHTVYISRAPAHATAGMRAPTQAVTTGLSSLLLVQPSAGCWLVGCATACHSLAPQHSQHGTSPPHAQRCCCLAARIMQLLSSALPPDTRCQRSCQPHHAHTHTHTHTTHTHIHTHTQAFAAPLTHQTTPAGVTQPASLAPPTTPAHQNAATPAHTHAGTHTRPGAHCSTATSTAGLAPPHG
jgi:hypothetical protein